MMEELFGSLLLETVFKLSSDDRWVVLLEAAEIKLTETVSSICKTFIESVGHYLNCEVRCSIGQIGTLTRIYPEFLKLEDMNKNRVSCRGGIFRLDAYRPKEPVYTPPPTELLEILLRENKADAFLRQAGAYLDGLVAADRLNHAVLELIRLDLTQLIYAVLRQKEIDAHLLFYNQTHETLESRALFSVQDFKRYLEYLVQTSVEYQHFTTQSKSIVEIIVEYIEHHYMEDISRKSLSDIVFLNPDYLASLFKKELGISLGTYLAGKRIETAKELLLKSDLPISVISLNVGYSNYSYFSHLFKDAVGCTPAEYRKQNH